MDYTIEPWTLATNHFADCTCGKWVVTSLSIETLQLLIHAHKALHIANGDTVEII